MIALQSKLAVRVVVFAAMLTACAGTQHVSSKAQQLDGSVLITAFGAVPDDDGDDTVAIQNALRSGASEVIVPCGTWIASSVLPPSNVTIRGERKDCVTIKQALVGPSVRLIMVYNASNVTVKDLTLDGNKANQSMCTDKNGNPMPCEHRAGVFVMNSPNVRIDNVVARYFSGDSFYIYYHSDNFTVINCTADGNDRDGIVLGGGTVGGSIMYSTFKGSRAQQFDTEGGKVDNVTVAFNTIDGTGSNDYAFTISGNASTSRSTGWTIANNTIVGGIEFVWVDTMLFTANIETNSTTKPCLTVYRTTYDVSVINNHFTDTQTSTPNSAVIYIAGTGIGQSSTRFKGQWNTLTVTGNAATFGYRVEGAVSVDLSDETIVGPGVAAASNSAVYFRATVTDDTGMFQSARLVHSTLRNFGSYGVTVNGNSTAKLGMLELAYNTCDDTSGTMKTCLSLDSDRSHAAKDIRVVGNQMTGGCATMIASDPLGVMGPWGEEWIVP